jgi:hypothetical protein
MCCRNGAWVGVVMAGTDMASMDQLQTGPGAGPRPVVAAWGSTGYLATAALILVGLAYLANGVATLVAPNYRGDLNTRWRERGYLRAGIDPYDVSVQFNGMKPNAAETRRIADHDLQNESAIDSSGYPPWGLAASFLFMPPGPERLAQAVFAAICLASLGLAVCYAFGQGRQWGTGPGLFMAACVFAMFSNAGTLRLGQYGLILNAFLICSLWAFVKRQAALSGLAMAVAAIKPTYSMSQVVVMVFRRQWVSLMLLAAVCAAASVVPWALTGVGPVEMVQQMLGQSAHVSEGDTSLLRLARSVIPYSSAVTILTAACVIGTSSLAWKYRNYSPLVATSAAAVTGRVFLYHRQYDNVMLVFPLLALGLLALAIRKPWAWVVFAVYGATLWAPLPYMAYRPPVIAALCTVWLAGLFMICRHAARLDPAGGADSDGAKEFPGRRAAVVSAG